jgi:clan AA aspartic protease
LSGFVGLSPVVRMKVRNLPLGAMYPSSGSVQAIVDTGYEGFLLVPRHVFDALSLGDMVVRQRKIEVADGRVVRSAVAYGTVEVSGVEGEIDGPVETMEGVTEVMVGVHLLSRFRLTLDYCLKAFSIRPCY